MNNFNSIDIIAVFALFLGLQNLEENREQTAYNDVHKANTEQAQYLLENLNIKFDEINKKLDILLKKGE